MMSNLSFEICQERLKSYLGQKYPQYLKLIKEFVQARLSLDEVDYHARKYFDASNVAIHRDYFTALLNKLQKVDKGGNISKKPPTKKKRLTKTMEQFRDIYVEKLPHCPEVDKKKRESLLEMSTTCANEGLLPENWMICGRLLASGLDYNIMDVTEDAVNILAVGTRIFIKNIVDSMLMKLGKHRPTTNVSTRPPWLCDMDLIPHEPTVYDFLKERKPFLFAKDSFLSKLVKSEDKESISKHQQLLRSETAALSLGCYPAYSSQSTPPFCITMKHLYRFLIHPQRPCKAPQLKSIQLSYDLIPHHFLRSFCQQRASLYLSKQQYLTEASKIPDPESLDPLLLTASNKPPPSTSKASSHHHHHQPAQHKHRGGSLQPPPSKQRRVAVTLGSPISSHSKVPTLSHDNDDNKPLTSSSRPSTLDLSQPPAAVTNFWVFDQVSP